MNMQHDDPHGDVLARALHAEAEKIRISGDGLTKIRNRVETKRRTRRWLVPATSLATVGVAAGVAFGAYAGLSGGSGRLQVQQPASGSSTTPLQPSQTPSAKPSATTPPTVEAQLTPVWPFSAYSEVQQWVQQGEPNGSSPWHLDPAATATFFVENTLGLPQQQVIVAGRSVADRTADIQLATTTTASGRAVTFGTVHLVRWGAGSKAPWEITGVTSSTATVKSPAVGAKVSSPLDISYTLNGGVEEDTYLSVWDGDKQLQQTHSVVGAGAQHATLDFGAPATDVGYVVMADVQSLSGTSTLTRLVVVPVTFVTAPVSPSQGSGGENYPPFFLAVRDQRIGLFYSQLGGLGRWLTSPQPGDGPSSPEITADDKWVYFLRADNNGVRSLMKVSINGGSEFPVISGKGDVNAFAIGGAHGECLAYTVVKSGAQDLNWSCNGNTGSVHQQSIPPMITSLAWAPDGRHLAAQVRSGMQWGLRIYDTTSLTSINSGKAVPGPNGQGLSYDAAGNLYYIVAHSNSQWELVQYTGHDVKHVSTFTLPAGEDPENVVVDITPDAEAALVGTPSGIVYRIEHGKAQIVTKLATSPTW